MALNKWIGIGRLTKKPELKSTQSGISVANFSVAVNRPYSNGGERETDFIDIVAWRGTAEFVSKHFEKGDPIQIQGSLQMRKYTDANGFEKIKAEIIADNVDFVEGYRRTETKDPLDALEAETKATVEDDDFPFF